MGVSELKPKFPWSTVRGRVAQVCNHQSFFGFHPWKLPLTTLVRFLKVKKEKKHQLFTLAASSPLKILWLDPYVSDNRLPGGRLRVRKLSVARASNARMTVHFPTKVLRLSLPRLLELCTLVIITCFILVYCSWIDDSSIQTLFSGTTPAM